MSSSRSWPWASEMTVSMSSDLNTTDVSQCLIMSRQINSDFPSSDVRTLCLIDTHIKTSTISRLFLISSTVKWWYLVMPTLLRAFSNYGEKKHYHEWKPNTQFFGTWALSIHRNTEIGSNKVGPDLLKHLLDCFSKLWHCVYTFVFTVVRWPPG